MGKIYISIRPPPVVLLRRTKMAAFGNGYGGASSETVVPLFPMTEDNNIWIAASDGNIAKVQAYVQADPSLLQKGDDSGYSPIHAATAWGHKELMHWLVAAGADVHARDADGDTPLHHCDKPEAAEYLITLGASPTMTNAAGQTPPMMHLIDGEEAMVEFWRSKGLIPEGAVIVESNEADPEAALAAIAEMAEDTGFASMSDAP